MSRNLLLFSLLILLLAACTRPVGGVAPTALPVDFPSPAPGSTPLCQPADLGTSSNSSGATDALMLGITLTNKSKNPCALSDPPQVTLFDNSNKALEIKVSNMKDSGTPTQIELSEDESAILSLVWRNYCQPLSKDNLTVRIKLSTEQSLDVSMELLAEPRCNTRTEPSMLLVAPYSYPP